MKTSCGRWPAKDLVEETNLHGTGSAGAGLAAVFDIIAGVEGVVELLALEGDFFAESCGDELVAQMAQVLTCGSAGVAGAV